MIVVGEHSGIANLVPGNPGQVDPPSLDTATPATTGGTLATGQYVYAVSDHFNTAAPGATPVPGTGESAGSVSAPIAVTGPAGSVQLAWTAVCHAADYLIYRAPYTPPVAPATTGTIGAWSLISTVAANTTADFLDPSGGSTTNSAGGGAGPKTFTDTGAAGTATGSSGVPTPTSKPSNEGAAVESGYEQNPVLNAAFAATLDGGVKYFGSDASKPYPNPSASAFATGFYSGAEYPAGASFSDGAATAIPRYPTNIYYNVSTNAQEVDEYQTLYDLPTCVPVAGVTTCNPPGTAFPIGTIVASVDQGMFQHMMGNDPRPHYFHQTNLMSQTTGTVNGVGDGLFYETMDPLLAAVPPVLRQQRADRATDDGPDRHAAERADRLGCGEREPGDGLHRGQRRDGQQLRGRDRDAADRHHRRQPVRRQPVRVGTRARGHEHLHRARGMARSAGRAGRTYAANRTGAGQRARPARARQGPATPGEGQDGIHAGQRLHPGTAGEGARQARHEGDGGAEMQGRGGKQFLQGQAHAEPEGTNGDGGVPGQDA